MSILTLRGSRNSNLAQALQIDQVTLSHHRSSGYQARPVGTMHLVEKIEVLTA